MHLEQLGKLGLVFERTVSFVKRWKSKRGLRCYCDFPNNFIFSLAAVLAPFRLRLERTNAWLACMLHDVWE